MSLTYKLHFLGCKANQSDALSVAGLLERAGWMEANESEQPALNVVQTCTVTMSADAQGRQLVRKLKRDNPSAKILMTGCYAERIRDLAEADYVIGNLDPQKMQKLSEIAGSAAIDPYPDFVLPAATSRTRPYIKIQDGCDARCSYCIIPSVRGKSRSLPIEEVVRRVEHFRDLGFREMIFTGISMGAYGKDLSPRINLAALMRSIESLSGDFRIRLSSLEPEEIDDEFIDVYTSCSRFQPHLHLPLQSASDRVLKKMRRQYLFHRYDLIVSRLFARMPDFNLGTDILVGFPEEDRDAFDETYRFVKNAPFAYCHVFPFSPRPGTPAEHYARAASHHEASDRAAMIREIAREKNVAYRKRFLGRPLRALALRSAKEALTDNYIRVELNESSSEAVLNVSIDRVEENKTYGRIHRKDAKNLCASAVNPQEV